MERLAGAEVPAPYRQLLVHSRDMTPTLETFYGQPLELRLLQREAEGGAYLREVVLLTRAGARPVEYGVIRIFLERFPARARRFILEERKPLGAILREEAVAHLGWPQAFFRAAADSRLSAVLELRRPEWLYGRRNLLLDAHRQVLAEVIEVVAPADGGTDRQRATP